jgi:hypothetical protein
MPIRRNKWNERGSRPRPIGRAICSACGSDRAITHVQADAPERAVSGCCGAPVVLRDSPARRRRVAEIEREIAAPSAMLLRLRAAAEAAADCLEEERNAAGDDAEEHPTLRRHAAALDALRTALADVAAFRVPSKWPKRLQGPNDKEYEPTARDPDWQG